MLPTIRISRAPFTETESSFYVKKISGGQDRINGALNSFNIKWDENSL